MPSTLSHTVNQSPLRVLTLSSRFLEWGEKYGGVFSLKIGSNTMVVLFDRKAVHDLVDKKGVIYSERPPNHVADIVTHGDSFAFMDNTPSYREQRKLASHNLSVCIPRPLSLLMKTIAHRLQPRVLDDQVGSIQDAE